MNRTVIIIALLALAVSTVSSIATARVLGRRTPGLMAATPAVDVEALERRVAQLARQMDAVKIGLSVRSVADAHQSDAAPVAAPAAADVGALAQRLDALEEVARRSGVMPGPLSAQAYNEAMATAVDRNAPLGQRVGALKMLRPTNGRADGRTPEVTAAMVELIENPEIPADARSTIIRQLSNVADERLKAPLLAVVSNDRDPETRGEAIETLMPFYTDPHVFDLITRLKHSDTDPGVRREAERRLFQWQERQRRP